MMGQVDFPWVCRTISLKSNCCVSQKLMISVAKHFSYATFARIEEPVSTVHRPAECPGQKGMFADFSKNLSEKWEFAFGGQRDAGPNCPAKIHHGRPIPIFQTDSDLLDRFFCGAVPNYGGGISRFVRLKSSFNCRAATRGG
jgi:hypothetical protein